MFFKKKRKESLLKPIYDQLNNGDFFQKNDMLFWRYNNKLCGVNVEAVPGGYIIDLDMLIEWLYPDDLTRKERVIKEEEEILFQKASTEYFAQYGKNISYEHTLKDYMYLDRYDR